MENVAANEAGCYQTSVGNKNQLNKVMDSLLNKVTAWLLTCGKELKVVSSPTLQRDVTDQYGGGGGREKRSDISDLSPVESKWINPSYRNHRSWLHPSKAKLHYTEKTAAQCVALFPVLPPAFVSNAALYYPWWKYNLPLICVPKPYKSKSSKVATFLHRYYVAFPAPSFNQERLITRDLDCYSFVAAHLRDGLIEERNKRERKCEKTGEGR